MVRHRGSNLARLERIALERNRRTFMNDLLSKLASVVNPTAPAHKPSLKLLLDEAAIRVKQLRRRVEMLKRRKQVLSDQLASGPSPSPIITVTELGDILEVCLISRLNDKVILNQVINVLEEEAAQVVALGYCKVGHRINYTISSQNRYRDFKGASKVADSDCRLGHKNKKDCKFS